MQRKENIIIKVVALATAATGLFSFVRFFKSNMQFLSNVRFVAKDLNALQFIPTLIILIIPVLKTAVAYGIFRSKHWAWISAVVMLSVDSLFRVSGAINWIIFPILFPQTSQPPISKGVITGSISILPSLVIAIISLISIFILIQKPIKNQLTEAGVD